MKTADVILQQLGGNHFLAMTGANHLVSDGDTLRMNLPKNGSKANRLWVTYNPDSDLYTMRFFKYTAPRLSKKTFTFSEEKIVEVRQFEDVFFDQLQPLFTEVTKMYTHL